MGVPVGDYLAIVDGAPEVTFEDAADIFVKLRMIKTPEEVEYMRQAAAITGRGTAEALPRDCTGDDRTGRGPETSCPDIG